MLNNKGFSILRIIIIIILVVVLFLLAKPSYNFLSKYIDRMNAKSNITKLETLASDYAKDNIDTYRKCVGDVDESCLISVDTLREKNYIYDNKILINPVTEEVLNGNILVCFNGETSFNSKYLQEYSDSYYCGNNFTKSETDTKNYYSGKKVTDVIRSEQNNIKNINGEYRYVSVNAKNYISFNNQTFRILGLVYDAAGNYRLKITSTKPVLFKSYSVNSEKFTDTEAYNYFNNGDYYNKMAEEYKRLIEIGSWDLGFCDDINNCLDTNSEKWNGAIAILSIKDIVYSTNCQQTTAECLATSYLDIDKEAVLNYATGNIYQISGNIIAKSDFRVTTFARPTFYIDSNVVIIEGNGGKYSPFKIGLGD